MEKEPKIHELTKIKEALAEEIYEAKRKRDDKIEEKKKTERALKRLGQNLYGLDKKIQYREKWMSEVEKEIGEISFVVTN